MDVQYFLSTSYFFKSTSYFKSSSYFNPLRYVVIIPQESSLSLSRLRLHLHLHVLRTRLDSGEPVIIWSFLRLRILRTVLPTGRKERSSGVSRSSERHGFVTSTTSNRTGTIYLNILLSPLGRFERVGRSRGLLLLARARHLAEPSQP